MADFNQDAQVDPSLRAFGDARSKTRYPSPFFDIGQQYVPPTVKELFKWVFFYATNNSFVGPALTKISRYPVTDLIFEDPNHALVDKWKIIHNNVLNTKPFLMEVNLDLLTYGNAFVTFNYPFSRFLTCSACNETYPWKAVKKKIQDMKITITCQKCMTTMLAKIKDVPYKSLENVRLIRINPEFIDIKYNDATGRHTYLYSIPDKLKRSIMSGDPDILEDTPQIFIDAIKERKKIKLSYQNLFHLKRPTLAGKDMGWGMPVMATALKDLFYFYQLRRAQEAIALEHTVPFDIIFPQANARFDPYVHSDLSNWKRELEGQLAKRRRDPNYKAILPFPVGFERIGGDGKALMLAPELDFLAKTIVGSMGIPQEFIYGGPMTWSGGSVNLRALENEFLHQRSQLLQLVVWMSERIKLYTGMMTPKSTRFSDFKMADDVQKQQLLFQAASLDKVSWHDFLLEMGKDPKIEEEKIRQEKEFQLKLRERELVAQTEAQGKAQLIQSRYNRMMQEELAANGGVGLPKKDPMTAQAIRKTVEHWARKLLEQPPEVQAQAVQRLTEKDPDFGAKLQLALQNNGRLPPEDNMQEPGQAENGQMPPGMDGAPALDMTPPGGQPGVGDQQPPQAQQPPKPAVNMKPMPQQKPPRRAGGL